jgi:hypothetical protein
VLVAFLAGLGASRPVAGAARGAVALVTGTTAYYAWLLFVTEDVSRGFALKAFVFWTVLALPAGLASGWIAATADRAAWALPAGAFLGEAVLVLGLRGRLLQTTIEAAAALLLAARAERVPRAAAYAAGAAAVTFGAGAAYRVWLV